MPKLYYIDDECINGTLKKNTQKTKPQLCSMLTKLQDTVFNLIKIIFYLGNVSKYPRIYKIPTFM